MAKNNSCNCDIDQIAKVWVNFNTAGVIGDSFGVSSVVKNSTGNFTVNFSTSFLNSNYSAVFQARDTSASIVAVHIQAQTVSSVSIECRGGTATILGIVVTINDPIDPNLGINLIVFGKI